MKPLIVCAGKNEIFSFATSIGVGLVQASVGLTQLCLEKKPEKLVFIGTCGIYKRALENFDGVNLNEKSHDFSSQSQEIQSLNLLEIYETRHAFNVEASSFLGDFYSPAACEINLNVSYETKKCNSSNYICADERVAARFAAMGLELENMEAFAVLSVAAKFGVDAVCFLCATNFCDSQAHQNFIKNHAQAKKNLENFLQEKNLI